MWLDSVRAEKRRSVGQAIHFFHFGGEQVYSCESIRAVNIEIVDDHRLIHEFIANPQDVRVRFKRTIPTPVPCFVAARQPTAKPYAKQSATDSKNYWIHRLR